MPPEAARRRARPAGGCGTPLAALLAAGLLVAAAAPAKPQEAAGAERLDAAGAADVRCVEAYLNRLDTVRARFLQVSSDGTYSEGDLYLSRPGRLRIEYDPPMPVLIVANGRHLIYHDRKLEQVTYLGLDSTPVGILIGETIALSGRLTVTRLERGAKVLRVTVIRTQDPLAGSITLVLGEAPMQLRKWIIRDAQGVTTTVSLFDIRFGVPLNPALFEFKPPAEPEPPN